MEEGRRSGSGFYPVSHIRKGRHLCGEIFFQRTDDWNRWEAAGAELDR